MSGPVRFALCGTGWIARVHAKAIADTPGAELVAAYNHRSTTLDAFVADYPVPTGTTDWTAFVEAVGRGVDVAIVATPNVHHAAQSIELLEAGAHVLVEKPMAVTTALGEAMVRAATLARRALMTGHMWRFDPDAQWLRREVAAGSLGRVVRTRSLGIHAGWGPSGWFSQRALAGGGALADMGVHAIDTTRFLLGDPRPVGVTARIGTYYGSYDVEDTAVLLIDWDDGTISQIEAGWWQVQSDGPEAATRVHGTRAFGSLFPTLVARERADETIEERTPPAFMRTDHCDPQLYSAQIAHAVDVARGEAAPVNGPDVGLTVVRIMEAAYRSAETGEGVRIG